MISGCEYVSGYFFLFPKGYCDAGEELCDKVRAELAFK